ncbi:hypothetical protein CQ13_04505 [Bradyrhizobium retamae]|uniref:Uncharacterized protein n=1 Tax=Bradyrhizobium retamae TaxID=1300035 RepID=A0A0R3N653_9BRAD|nr:hypothetical protein CQ13_04505 [Bradyrhizobium retamae]
MFVKQWQEHCHPLLRPVARLAGVVAPNGKAPVYLRATITMKRKDASVAARRLSISIRAS